MDRKLYVRTAEAGGKYYLNLADEQWRAVEIDETGWRVVANPPVRFQRPRGMLALPEPVAGGTLHELQGLLNLASEYDFTRIIVWLIAALNPCGPCPVLAIRGEPSSGKSTMARILRSLVDPNTAVLRSPPPTEHDFWFQANSASALVFDNVSRMPAWLSSGLCRVATAPIRTQPTILTSVSDVIARSDLAVRAIMIELPNITNAERVDDETINARFEAAQPRILGALLDMMVSFGMRHHPSVQPPKLAHFALGATRGGPALAQQGDVMYAYQAAITETSLLPTLQALMDEHNRWSGTASDLLNLLSAADNAKRQENWPRTPEALLRQLRCESPRLQAQGIAVLQGRNAGARHLLVTKT